MSRRAMTGDYTVGGDERQLPSAGAAISLALNLACHADGERQFGVYERSTQIARVRRDEQGNVTVTMTTTRATA